MANMTTSTSPDSAQKGNYDPIKMLHVFLSDNSDAPKYLSNYLLNRLGDQIMWYDKRSGEFKNKWQRNRMLVISLSAAIPFMVGLMGLELGGESFNKYFDIIVKLAVGLAGVTIAVLEGYNSLFKSQDLYIDYRATAEQLRQEFGFFLGNSGDYAGLLGDASYAMLIANAEAIMVGQNNRWAEMARKKEKTELAGEIQTAMQDFLKEYALQSTVPPSKPTTTDEKDQDDSTEPPEE